MKRFIPLALFTLLTVFILASVLFKNFTANPTISNHPLPAGGDFTLHGFKQKDISLNDFRGKVVLLYFGYTSCPDICPTSLATISASLKELSPEESKKVQVLFISVDPERDTTENLSHYSSYFHSNILGITGTKEEVDQVVKKYSASYKKVESDSAMGYLVDHSASIYVINPQGKLVKMLPHGVGSQQITQTIKSLLG